MENVAFTTLIVLLLAIPGYFARSAYFSEDFSRDVIPKSISEEIYLSILYSVPFHIIAISGINRCFESGRTNTYVDFEMALGFITGRFAKEGEGIAQLPDNLYQYFDSITLYFGALAIVAFGVGRIFRYAVWTFRLDVSLPSIFRYRNRWLYTFTGRDMKSKEALLGIVDAMCLLTGDKTRLYRGVVVGFDSSPDGNLDQIRLGLAYRGKFAEGGGGFYWEEVPGDVFVLKYNTVQSLNVTYVRKSSFNPNSPSFVAPAPEDAPVPESDVLPSAGPVQEPLSLTPELSQEPHE